ncbi:MAG: 4Fe-4S binding protein [Deltaproteobacteria bacterium]|nr:4Fe-4S binding protein [Deltaproteobacteria bacterium]
MQPAPLRKLFDAPLLSLDGTSVEMASLLFLFVAVMMATSIRAHRQAVRHAVQLVSFIFFYFVVYSCLGVFGMIRNSLYGLTLLGSVYTESFYWMALPVLVIAATLVSGPLFCGWICPTGTLQELTGMVRRRFVKPRARPTRRRMLALGLFLLSFIAVVAWLGTRKELFVEDSSLHWGAGLILVCYLVVAGVLDDLPTRSLRVLSLSAIFASALFHWVVSSPMHFAFTSRSDPASMLTTAVILVSSLFVLRAWCRYLCPWGYLMGFLNRFSRSRIVRNEALCNECQICTQACDVGAIDRGVIRIEHCQFCLACVDHCPTSAFQIVDTWRQAEGSASRDLVQLTRRGASQSETGAATDTERPARE